MPLPFLVWGAVAAGTALVGKLIYDKVTEDDSPSSPVTSRSGPSREELQRRELETIYSDFQREFKKFWQTEDQLLCLNGKRALYQYKALSNAVREDRLAPHEALKQRKALEMDKASAVNDMTINNVAAFLSERFSGCERMIDRVNVVLSVYEESPRMAFAENYDLCRDEYWLSKLIFACARERVEALEDLPGDWNRVTPELARRWKDVQDFEAATAEGGEPRVVVCGLLKAGKSSLLNSLFDDRSNQHFPTARNRKTLKNQSEVRNGICFIDTPGLDYNNTDTEEAKAAYAGADLLLFVHNGSKELEEGQLVFLRELHDMYDDLADRILFVITSKEEAGADLEALKDTISEKVMERCAFSPKIFAVENTSYRSEKEKVRASSGITELRAAIEAFCRARAVRCKEQRQERRAKVLYALNVVVYDVVEAILEDRKRHTDSQVRICKAFVKMVENKQAQVNRVLS